ncbi:glycosyltransferase family 1 protein [Persicobacter diffluens]|uniref:Glycosyl transferase n=1 Tax=Persicobacter diffluens TaxID=981 RepID=A0AAN5AJC7_9BACT|nr:glycosyl transferase [Persicobacter diffluens]
MRKIVIDATNIGLGGGVTHLIELLKHSHLCESQIIVYASENTLARLDGDRVIKRTHPLLNKSIFHRIFYQKVYFDRELFREKEAILFSITGDYSGTFSPMVGMSRNMLLYEREHWDYLNNPKESLKFFLGYLRQRRSFRKAKHIIFISKYAQQYVSDKLNLPTSKSTVIHHGVSRRFVNSPSCNDSINDFSVKRPFVFTYVSTIHTYKNHVPLIEAVGQLRKEGFPVKLRIIGGIINRKAGKAMFSAMKKVDRSCLFIEYLEHQPYEEIEKHYKNSHGLVYSSTCENMPNILIEAMSSGVPIACSDKQPMPEFLKGNGYYFDALDVMSVKNAMINLMEDPKASKEMAERNMEEVQKYSWEKTAKESFSILKRVYDNHK